jgi:hypothetical protein
MQVGGWLSENVCVAERQVSATAKGPNLSLLCTSDCRSGPAQGRLEVLGQGSVKAQVKATFVHPLGSKRTRQLGFSFSSNTGSC